MDNLPGVEPNLRHTTANKGAAICKKEGIDETHFRAMEDNKKKLIWWQIL